MERHHNLCLLILAEVTILQHEYLEIRLTLERDDQQVNRQLLLILKPLVVHKLLIITS